MTLSYVREIMNQIQTRHLCTPMNRARTFATEDREGATAEWMATANFDHAPIVHDEEVVGYVARDDLDPEVSTTLSRKVKWLTDSQLISGDTPIRQLMTALEERPFLFVVEGSTIAGLVTPSDLNKQPGRTYFYLLIASLEISLAEMIRSEFIGDWDSALQLISDRRQTSVKNRLLDLRAGDVEADAVAALDFTDLLTIVKKTPDLLAKFDGFSSRRWQKEVCGPLSELRHEVVHGVRTLATDQSESLDRLIRRDRLLRTLIGL